ncbi:MAG: serine/threonine-protein kinase [Betaproteobacteria bacterium]|nr:MAG: serine/threonine-protein kinase [Betaproteobacteria bacterium]
MQITASHWHVLSPLVDTGLRLDSEARAQWLSEQTQLLPDELARLTQLMAAASSMNDTEFLPELTGLLRPPGASKREESLHHAGDRVGPYTLERVLGYGGMAEVWLARRSDGAYEREVALKLALANQPKSQAAERMMREKNVLAALEHPSIARLYDAGVAHDGRPYLAMEYVEGEQILNYANRRQLNLSARCTLMIEVLDALHYAHQHLVVHRDLKPSNIMVRADGRVALLDFGVAKVLEAPDLPAEATELTRMMGSALTLAYAAPEQLLADHVTTSADVYAAGVVLFELLTGARPFASAERSASALLRAMDDLRVPSALPYTTIERAQAHGFDTLAAWRRAYSGDLAAICARSLRREPSARYPSALSMREDIVRHYDHRPVHARSGAWSYRWQKFFARNRVAIGVSAFAGIAAAGFGVHAWQKTQALQTSSLRANAVESVIKNLFDGMNPNSNTAQTFTAKQLLDRSRPLLMESGALSPEATSHATMMMAKLYLDISEYDDAARLLDNEIDSAKAAGDAPREIWAQCLLTDVRLDQSQYQIAYDTMQLARSKLATVSAQRDLLGPQVNYRLGTAALFLGRYTEADGLLSGAASAVTALPQSASRTELHANVLIKQGTLARVQDNLLKANELFSAAQKMLENTTGMQLTKDVLAIEMLPATVSAGQYDEAIRQAELTLASLGPRATPGSGYPVITALHYATALLRTGRLTDAGIQANRILESAPSNASALQYQGKLITAQIALYSGQTQSAQAQLNELLKTGIEAPNPRLTQWTRRHLAHSFLQQGRNDDALALLTDIERTQQASSKNERDVDTAVTRVLLGVTQLRLGEIESARRTLEKARDTLTATRGLRHPATLLSEAYLTLLPKAESDAPSTVEVNRVVAVALAARITRELGWQHGAMDLARRLKESPQSLHNVPAVL